MDINLIKAIIRLYGKSWVKYSEVCWTLKYQGKISIDKDFFLNNTHDFRIYTIPDPNDFYIALAEKFPEQMASPQHSPKMHPDRKPRSTRAIPPKIKLCKDKILEVYGIDDTEEDKVFQEIKTAADFQEVLGKIIKKIARESNQSAIDIQQIGKEFYTLYQQPIRSSFKHYFAALKLVDILQTIEFITVDSKQVILKKRNSEGV